jgi:hypothetical protein
VRDLQSTVEWAGDCDAVAWGVRIGEHSFQVFNRACFFLIDI